MSHEYISKIVYTFPKKYHRGLTETEVTSVLNLFPNLNHDHFWQYLNGVTFTYVCEWSDPQEMYQLDGLPADQIKKRVKEATDAGRIQMINLYYPIDIINGIEAKNPK